MKPGDRVRVCFEDDCTVAVKQALGIRSDIGRTGTVVKLRYNKNMAGYGLGDEILVRMDGDASCGCLMGTKSDEYALKAFPYLQEMVWSM